jgi:hypothetical protein
MFMLVLFLILIQVGASAARPFCKYKRLQQLLLIGSMLSERKTLSETRIFH